MPSADYAMSETADDENRRKRKYHVTAESIGRHLVMAELVQRGFEAELAGASYEKRDMLVWERDSSPKHIQIKTVRSPPWYVRRASFGKRADQGRCTSFLERRLRHLRVSSWPRTVI